MKSLFYPAFFFSFVCFCLGLWQWQRLEWKQNLLHDIGVKCEKSAPKVLPPPRDWGNLNGTQWQWQKVRFSGVAEKTKLKLWRGTKGYQPLWLVRLSDGGAGAGAILIWGSSSGKGSEAKSSFATPSTTRATYEAILYPSQERRFFDPENDVQKGLFHVLETKQIIALLAGTSARSVRQTFPLAAKLDGTCPTLPNNHLLYMLTWWLLMIFMPLVVIFGKKEE